MLPSSDFQVASSEAIRLPTLKELIVGQTNDQTSASPVHLDLLPFRPNRHSHKDSNFVLESDADRANAYLEEPRSSERWSLENSRNENNLAAGENELDLIGGKADYVEDNIADELQASSSKKRIDREDSTTPRPTTMRGTPLINLRQKQSTRGFYVTRSGSGSQFDTESTTLPMENEESAARTSTPSPTEVTTVLNEESSTEDTLPSGSEGATTSEATAQRERRLRPSRHEATTLPTFTDYPIVHATRNGGTVRSRGRVRSTPEQKPSTETAPSADSSTLMDRESESIDTPSVGESSGSTGDAPTTTGVLIRVDSSTESVTSSPVTTITTSTDPIAVTATELPEAPYNFSTMQPATESLETVTEALPTRTVSEDSEIGESLTTATEPKVDSEVNATSKSDRRERVFATVSPPKTEAAATSSRRRQKVKHDSNYEFGYRAGARARQRAGPSVEHPEERRERTRPPRRRVPLHRGRPARTRRPQTTPATFDDATVPEAFAPDRADHGTAKQVGTTTLPTVKEEGMRDEENPKESEAVKNEASKDEETSEKVEASAIATTEQGNRLEVSLGLNFKTKRVATPLAVYSSSRLVKQSGSRATSYALS